MTTHGIDVSKWQGNIDWAKVKNSGKVDFAILKAGGSDAGYYKDSQFERNYKEAKANGIPVGAYYFVGKGCTSTAAGVADAKKFIEILKGKEFEYPVYMDCEVTAYSAKKGATDAAIAFCETMEAYGYWVGIYGSTHSTFESRLDDSRLQSYAHWVAQYANACYYKGKVGVGMWQYSSSGSVSGINGRVDMDACYVDYPTKIRAKGLNGLKRASQSNPSPVVINATIKKTRQATEAEVRADVVSAAKFYFGCKRGSNYHKKIVDTFNTVQPDGWPMNYTASWCATFASAIAIEVFGKEKANKYFPLSASCGAAATSILNKSKKMGIWVENDAYTPKPGDWILYDWEDSGYGDNTGAPDHVGIVTSVANGKIVVIEGNKHDACGYRTVGVNGMYIRGFVTPDYAALAKTITKTDNGATSATNSFVDGEWGIVTTKTAQKKFGTTVDGYISNQPSSNRQYLEACSASSWEFVKHPTGGSELIRAMQKLFGITADGYCGKQTIKALQSFLNTEIKAGLDVDGYCGVKTVKAFQTWLAK